MLIIDKLALCVHYIIMRHKTVSPENLWMWEFRFGYQLVEVSRNVLFLWFCAYHFPILFRFICRSIILEKLNLSFLFPGFHRWGPEFDSELRLAFAQQTVLFLRWLWHSEQGLNLYLRQTDSWPEPNSRATWCLQWSSLLRRKYVSFLETVLNLFNIWQHKLLMISRAISIDHVKLHYATADHL